MLLRIMGGVSLYWDYPSYSGMIVFILDYPSYSGMIVLKNWDYSVYSGMIVFILGCFFL